MKEEKTSELKSKNKKSFKETIILMFRRKWFADSTQTALIVAILFALFIGINLYVRSLELQEIDVTENKIYTLSDASKEVISKIDEKVKIYIYGFDEDNSLVSFIKQYVKANDKISYEILTKESNLAKVQEFELSEGYQIVILETENSSKIIDTSYEFYSYDYTTGQEVDLTEQCLTNSLLGITTKNKPKIYFTTGHEEYDTENELGVLNTYLKNESYIIDKVNLLTTGKVPEDCNLLLLMSPVKDFVEAEVNAILDYINKGGDLIITSDVGNLDEPYTNLQRIYDAYGVTLNHSGYVYETESNRTLSDYPSIFMPEVSPSNDITAEIYSDGAVWLVYAGRLNFVSEEQLETLNVTREDLLTSSENSLFITDLSKNIVSAAETAETGKSVIASILTKTITPSVEEAEGVEAQDAVESKLLIMANAGFITDYTVEQLSETYPVSYLANNKDFMLNSISSLTSREDTIKIRKDMSTSTYTATEEQHVIVMCIIFTVPIIIILSGIIVWHLRRRKK